MQTSSFKDLITAASCTEIGFRQYMSNITHIFSIADGLIATHEAPGALGPALAPNTPTITQIVAFYSTNISAISNRNTKCKQRWDQLRDIDARFTDLIENAFVAHVAQTIDSEEPFVMPKCEEKCSILYLWVLLLLEHKVNGTLESRREELVTNAHKRWDKQVKSDKNVPAVLKKLQFDSWDASEKQEFLNKVRKVPLGSLYALRGAVSARSMILLRLIEKGISHLFSQFRKPNVWEKEKDATKNGRGGTQSGKSQKKKESKSAQQSKSHDTSKKRKRVDEDFPQLKRTQQNSTEEDTSTLNEPQTPEFAESMQNNLTDHTDDDAVSLIDKWNMEEEKWDLSHLDRRLDYNRPEDD